MKVCLQEDIFSVEDLLETTFHHTTVKIKKNNKRIRKCFHHTLWRYKDYLKIVFINVYYSMGDISNIFIVLLSVFKVIIYLHEIFKTTLDKNFVRKYFINNSWFNVEIVFLLIKLFMFIKLFINWVLIVFYMLLCRLWEICWAIFDKYSLEFFLNFLWNYISVLKN